MHAPPCLHNVIVVLVTASPPSPQHQHCMYACMVAYCIFASSSFSTLASATHSGNTDGSRYRCLLLPCLLRLLSPAVPSYDQCCLGQHCSLHCLQRSASCFFALPHFSKNVCPCLKFSNKNSAFVFTRGNGLGCCCCRQFCLFSKTRPPLLWKSWSPCLSTLSPCKRVWPSECACCSWSCILPAAAMHRLQVRPHHCTAYLLNSKALQFCICSMCSTRILACNEETRVLQLLSVC